MPEEDRPEPALPPWLEKVADVYHSLAKDQNGTVPWTEKGEWWRLHCVTAPDEVETWGFFWSILNAVERVEARRRYEAKPEDGGDPMS